MKTAFQKSLRDACRTHTTLKDTLPTELLQHLKVVRNILVDHPIAPCEHPQLFVRTPDYEKWIAVHDDFTVGAHNDNDLQLDFRYVSRHHCSLSNDGQSWLIQDANSSNGVYVNGKRTAKAPLKEGDIIQVGMVTLFFFGKADSPHGT